MCHTRYRFRGRCALGTSTLDPLTINVFMLAMLKNPEVQARAHAELDFIIGKEQLPTFSDMHSLPYIMIIVKEAFF